MYKHVIISDGIYLRLNSEGIIATNCVVIE